MDSEAPVLDKALEKAMGAVVCVLRQILDNIQEERQAYMMGRAAHIQHILEKRDMLLGEMEKRQQLMASILGQMCEITSTGCDGLENLSDLIGGDKIDLLILRDQILALANSIEAQNMQNTSLLRQQALMPKPQPKHKRQALAVIEPDTEEA